MIEVFCILSVDWCKPYHNAVVAFKIFIRLRVTTVVVDLITFHQRNFAVCIDTCRCIFRRAVCQECDIQLSIADLRLNFLVNRVHQINPSRRETALAIQRIIQRTTRTRTIVAACTIHNRERNILFIRLRVNLHHHIRNDCIYHRCKFCRISACRRTNLRLIRRIPIRVRSTISRYGKIMQRIVHIPTLIGVNPNIRVRLQAHTQHFVICHIRLLLTIIKRGIFNQIKRRERIQTVAVNYAIFTNHIVAVHFAQERQHRHTVAVRAICFNKYRSCRSSNGITRPSRNIRPCTNHIRRQSTITEHDCVSVFVNR